MKGLTLMYDYRAKVAGIIMSAIGIIAMICEKVWKFSTFNLLPPDRCYQLFLWFALFGLFMMASSKEKKEDERTNFIRAKAIRFAFILLVSIMFALTFTAILYPKKIILDVSALYILITIALLVYLLMFNVGLHFDFLWEYEDKGLVENLKSIGHNKWGILAYLAIAGIIYVVLTFIF